MELVTGHRKRAGVSRRLSAVAVVAIVAIGAYFLATELAPGRGSGPTGSGETGSQTTGPTSTVGTVSTVVEQKGTVALRYYDWTSFKNLTLVVFDNGTLPFVINTVSFSGGALGTGSPPASLNVTALAGGCTPTGSSPPFKLPASCGSGEAITIHAAPPPGISPCSGPGVFLIVTLGQTQQVVNLDLRVGASSANPNGSPPQNCTTSTPLVGYTAGNMDPNSYNSFNLAPLQGDRYVEVNLSSSEPLDMYLHYSGSIVYRASGQTGIYNYCVPVTGTYELELYNPGPNVNTVFVYVYDLTNGTCTPGG